MESDNTDIAEASDRALSRRLRKERNDILEVLVKLVITRRDSAPIEEAEEAYENACAIIKEWGPVIVQEEQEGVDALSNKGDMTLTELVALVHEHEAGSMMITGFAEEDSDELAWVVAAAIGKSAAALYRWNQIDYDDDIIEQRARAAYEAYGAFTDNKNYQGNPMPAWEKLPDSITGAWQAATMEITQLCEGDNSPEDAD